MSTPAYIDIQSKDLDILDSNLIHAGGKVPDLIDAYVSERADIIVRIGKERAHRDTGMMADTWHKEKVGFAHYIVVSKADYTIYEVNRDGSKDGTPHDFITETLNEYYSKYDKQLTDKYLKLIVAEVLRGL